MLAHPCNVGYHNLSNLVLSRFAGQPIRNVAELARAVSRCEEDQLVPGSPAITKGRGTLLCYYLLSLLLLL